MANRYAKGKVNTWKGLFLRLDKTPEVIANIGDRLLPGKDEHEVLKIIREYKSRPDWEKFMVSEFPALGLEIGHWKKAAHCDNDIVVKFFFCMRKIVWEVIDGGVKKRVEISWSDVSALGAIFVKGKPSTLEIELARPPEFSYENTPHPMRHMDWVTTQDFTDGEAQKYWRHTVTFAEGILEEHYQKLIHSNGMFYVMSHRPFPLYNSPFFDLVQNDDPPSNPQHRNIPSMDHTQMPIFNLVQNDDLPSNPQHQNIPSMDRTQMPIYISPIREVHPPVATNSTIGDSVLPRTIAYTNVHQLPNFGNMDISNEPDLHDARMRAPIADNNTDMDAIHTVLAWSRLNNPHMQICSDEFVHDAPLNAPCANHNTAMDAKHADLARSRLNNSQVQFCSNEQTFHVGSSVNGSSNVEEHQLGGESCLESLAYTQNEAYLGSSDEHEVLKIIREYKSRPMWEKFMVSEFPALRLEIGRWEKAAHCDNDIVVKFYFSMGKILWEVIDGGVKKRVEISLRHISALRAIFAKGKPSTLEIELARPPEFSYENTPHPMGHMDWVTTQDFTDGEAQKYRRHTVTFAEGILEEHYQKLINSSRSLFIKSHRPFPLYNSPFFDLVENDDPPSNPQHRNIKSMDHSQMPIYVVPLKRVHPPVYQLPDFGNMNILNDPDVHDAHMEAPIADHNADMDAMHTVLAWSRLNNPPMQICSDELVHASHLNGPSKNHNTAIDAMHADSVRSRLNNSQVQICSNEQTLHVGSSVNGSRNVEEHQLGGESVTYTQNEAYLCSSDEHINLRNGGKNKDSRR